METFANEEAGFQLWLCELLASHPSLQGNAVLADSVRQFLTRTNQYHQEHGNYILQCRGQKRVLVSPEQAGADGRHNQYARWYDFVYVAPNARQSGPFLLKPGTNSTRRFEALCLKVQASRNRAKFGMTDDTGYLFPCLQQTLPRAFFLVMDHATHQVFMVHGNKKFAGQGDEGVEEGTDNNATTTDLQAPPVKCFPGTETLKPSHYIFTWKANGKNAGVYGYTDPNGGDIWLFVNSKGVCECAGRLKDIMAHPDMTTFSDLSMEKNPTYAQLPPSIFQCFAEIWNHGLHQELILSLWKRGYLLLFEFCDNKHIVLEYGQDNRPVDHLAFIGMVRLPQQHDTLHSGLTFRVDDQFTFDLWRANAPAYTGKPTLKVKLEHLETATRELMKGRFFPKEQREWFDPKEWASTEMQFLTGEGAVCYEMAPTNDGDSVIRQLFKAKTASYITHRQFRGFLQRPTTDDDATIPFGARYKQVLQFCQRKFGKLTEKPYPDPTEFCQDDPQEVVAAAALFYTHFAMWVQEMALKLDTTVAGLVGMMNTDCQVPVDSNVGRDFQKTAQKMGLREEDILVKGDPSDDNEHPAMLTIRCGMAFRLAEFMTTFDLDHSKVFANPKEMVKDLQQRNFVWDDVPTGNVGTITIGFNNVFPLGQTPETEKEPGKKKGKKRKKKIDVLRPFKRSLATFLGSNPQVKLRLGARSEKPEALTFASSDGGEVFVSCFKMDEFRDSLLTLPGRGKEMNVPTKDDTETGFQRLDNDAAVVQAEVALRKAFPRLEDLFEMPTDLTLGDVTGRLIPIIRSSASGRKILIIRGVSGVGKSTLAKACQSIWGADHVAVAEADHYFGPTCPYSFALLSAAHGDAETRAREALGDNNIRLLVVSNTGIKAREYTDYLQMAIDMQASVSILTLDTETSLEHLQNVHNVPLEKVNKMAKGLRAPENNPEGKTVDEILAIGSEQALKDGFSTGVALAWTLLGTEGAASVRQIYIGFLEYAKEQGILVSPQTIRPPNPHVTLAFVRPSSNIKEVKQLVDVWGHHGSTQEMTLSEVRYSIRSVGKDADQQKILVSLAVRVASFSPDLVPIETPHITIAYDPDHATAADSNKLWQPDHQYPENVSAGAWNFQSSCSAFSGIVETGAYKSDLLVHRRPEWLRKRTQESK